MVACRVALAVLMLSAGCSPCEPSSGVQITLEIAPGVDLSAAARLHLLLDIEGQSTRSTDVTLNQPLTSGSTLLFVPEPVPSGDYQLALTVEVWDSGGALLGLGSTLGKVSPLGCNRLVAAITPVDGAPDLATPAPDLSAPIAPDLAVALDASCDPGIADEDKDSVVNPCDSCPADSDSPAVDSDSDGIGDACDPDRTRPGNQRLLFDPFDDNRGWSGSYTLVESQCSVDTGAAATSYVGSGVALPSGVRGQTLFTADSVYGSGAAGLYIGTRSDPGASDAVGIVCLATHDGSGDHLTLSTVHAGQATSSISQPLAAPWVGSAERMRLYVQGMQVNCELSPSGGSLSMQPLIGRLQTAPTGAQYLALWSMAGKVRYASVDVISTAP